jgi:predicted choloylglycine hydrolase
MSDKVEKYIGSGDLSFLWEEDMKEAVYKFNIGFEEMVKFYNKANPQEVKKMERIIKNNDWTKFKVLIKQVLGVELQ